MSNTASRLSHAHRVFIALFIVATLLTACDSKRGGGNNHSGPDSTEPVTRTVTSLAAARLAAQATFGVSNQTIQEILAAGSPSAWIDTQMAEPVSRTLPYTQQNSNGSDTRARHYVWWDNIINGNDQLRQRVAFALSQLFVVSDLDYTLGNSQYGLAHYYDMLAENAFGNYRELLEAVTLHPVMGIYLSMVEPM